MGPKFIGRIPEKNWTKGGVDSLVNKPHKTDGKAVDDRTMHTLKRT